MKSYFAPFILAIFFTPSSGAMEKYYFQPITVPWSPAIDPNYFPTLERVPSPIPRQSPPPQAISIDSPSELSIPSAQDSPPQALYSPTRRQSYSRTTISIDSPSELSKSSAQESPQQPLCPPTPSQSSSRTTIYIDSPSELSTSAQESPQQTLYPPTPSQSSSRTTISIDSPSEPSKEVEQSHPLMITEPATNTRAEYSSTQPQRVLLSNLTADQISQRISTNLLELLDILKTIPTAQSYNKLAPETFTDLLTKISNKIEQLQLESIQCRTTLNILYILVKYLRYVTAQLWVIKSATLSLILLKNNITEIAASAQKIQPKQSPLTETQKACITCINAIATLKQHYVRENLEVGENKKDAICPLEFIIILPELLQTIKKLIHDRSEASLNLLRQSHATLSKSILLYYMLMDALKTQVDLIDKCNILIPFLSGKNINRKSIPKELMSTENIEINALPRSLSALPRSISSTNLTADEISQQISNNLKVFLDILKMPAAQTDSKLTPIIFAQLLHGICQEIARPQNKLDEMKLLTDYLKCNITHLYIINNSKVAWNLLKQDISQIAKSAAEIQLTKHPLTKTQIECIANCHLFRSFVLNLKVGKIEKDAISPLQFVNMLDTLMLTIVQLIQSRPPMFIDLLCQSYETLIKSIQFYKELSKLLTTERELINKSKELVKNFRSRCHIVSWSSYQPGV